MGRLQARNLDIEAVDLSPFDNQYDGSLGMDFLVDYDLDIDTIGRRLILYQAHGECSHHPTVVLNGDVSVVDEMSAEATVSLDHYRVRHSTRLFPRVEVWVQGRKLRALLDSGAPISSMYRDVAASLKLPLDMSKPGVAPVVPPEPLAGRTTTLPQLDVGDLSLTNVPLHVIDHPSVDYDYDLRLGQDFMQLVHVWISQSSNALVFQYPPKRSPEP